MYGLSNSGEEKLEFAPFWVGPKPGCPDSVRAGSQMENVNFCTLESHNFFVLVPFLVKLHIRTRLIESFPQTFRSWWCAEEKLHFTPFHTLRQLKRDEALFPPVHNKVTMYARLAVIFCTFGCSYSSVLRPILLKLHILTRLIVSFPMVYGLWRCIEATLSIPLGAHA